jgi:hypothetical protein
MVLVNTLTVAGNQSCAITVRSFNNEYLNIQKPLASSVPSQASIEPKLVTKFVRGVWRIVGFKHPSLPPLKRLPPRDSLMRLVG